MGNSSAWAVSAGIKFREVQRTSENPTTVALAEGLTHLSEAVRELHQELESIQDKIKALSAVPSAHG
jgi:Tfp pilus assembly protein FimV